MSYFSDTLAKIKPLDHFVPDRIEARWDRIGKPLKSLGLLEKNLALIGGITGRVDPVIGKKALVVMCADNGVVEEGVTQTDRSVTATVAENFFDDLTCTSILCKRAGCDQFVMDVGMAVDTPRTERVKCAYGTNNFVKGPAMTREEAIFALEAGMKKAEQLKDEGYGIIAVGEMGIGNTTTASALASVFLGVLPETVTGRGAGLSGEGLRKKVAAIETGIRVNRPDREDPIDVLSKLGGFDIAAMAGVYLGGAAFGIPTVIDGFISAVAALTAALICPNCRDYILASHVSAEPAGAMVLKALGKSPMLTCEMCLGEGSGAVAALPLLEMAEEVYHKMGTFEDIRVEAYVPLT